MNDASSQEKPDITPVELNSFIGLKAFIVSKDPECLLQCSQELARFGVETGVAISTESGAQALVQENYHMLIVDPEDIDWHHLQLCAATRSLLQKRAMTVVAVLYREGTVVEHRWGEGNDFDEKLSFPLRRNELATFILGCARYCFSEC